MTDNDIFFMHEALKEAALAAASGEVPIGAVAVKDGVICARGRNQVEKDHSVTSHAEICVLRQLEEQLSDWRMTGITLYVTKEPSTSGCQSTPGKAGRSTAPPQPPPAGSRNPKTMREKRALISIPAHIRQGSLVT